MKRRLLAMALAVIIITVSSPYGTAAEVDLLPSDRAATVYTLQDSTVYGSWSSSFENYNCYAYALGLTDDFHWPGEFSGISNELDLNVSGITIYTLACHVRADLMSTTFSNQCVAITTTAPTSLSSGQSCICVRKAIDDYHFMKLISGSWYHKPGNTHILKYKYTPTASREWTNECSFEGVSYEGYTTYDSAIYFLIYSQNHGSTTYTKTGNDYHAGAKHFYEYGQKCDSCGVFVSTTWTSRACSGPPCSIIQGVTPTPEVV